jgi:hypothetical protein
VTLGSFVYRKYTCGLISDVHLGKWEPHEYLRENPALEKVQLLGENSEQDVLTEHIKFLIASLPLLIEKMKAANYCFEKPLTLAELMVDEFDQFVIAEGIMLEKVTRAGLSRTYKSSAGLIREIIGDPVPPDIEHLISKMKMRRTPAYLILVHPSLTPLVSRSQAYCDAHDILCANISKNDIAALLKCLQDSLKQWDHTVTSNKLLKHFFGQAVKNTKHLFSNLWDLECNSLKHLKTLGMYTRNQVSTLTLCKFTKVLPFIYWMLWDKKLLTKLETENYFCQPGSACCRPGFCLRKNIRLSLESNKVNCKSELP